MGGIFSKMNNRTKGMLCIICAAMFFSLMNMFVHLAGDVPSLQKVFFRNFIAMLFAFCVLKKDKISLKCKKSDLKFLFARSAFGFVGIVCNFYAVDHLVLSDASMLNKMSPFFAVVFSLLLLKERVNLVQAIAVIGAFIGSIFIIKPSFANADMSAALIGLLGGLAAGVAYTCVRVLGSKKVPGAYIVFFFSTFSFVVSLPFAIVVYEPMTWGQTLSLLGASFAGCGGQFAITSAYCFAPAREISVYDYSQIIFSAILGFFIFNQLPDHWSVLGYLLICGMGVMMFIHSKRETHEK